MKKLILFLFICIAFNKLIVAQQYYQFPDSNAVWRVNDVRELSFPPYYQIYKFQYLMFGDTLIGSYNYKKIKKEGDCCIPLYILGNIDNGYVGALREDTITKKVYVIMKNSMNENLLFDFDLNIGDTLFGLYAAEGASAYGNNYLIVSSIDSILINNNYRKRFNIGIKCGEDSAYIVEGIGGNGGFFENHMQHVDCSGSDLVCFRVNNTVLFPDTATSFSCDLSPLSISNNSVSITFNIYPNPSSDKIIIEFNDNYKISEIKIKCFDVLGQEEKIIFIEYPNQIVIETNNLKQGIYFVSFYKNEKIFRNEKIIINHNK